MRNDESLKGRVGFCVGTGRCGTTFLSEIVKRERRVASSHERQRLAATFHMYCKWHGIAVDSAGFLRSREQVIRQDLSGHDYSFESNALLSHSVEELFHYFDARFLLLVRNPIDTVASFAVRNWFIEPPSRADATLPPSFEGREGEKTHHFLGRIIPSGDEFDRWSEMTPLGRIAWFWNARNRAILEQFERLPEAAFRIQRLEDFDIHAYREVANFLGWEPGIEKPAFDKLAAARLNHGPNEPRLQSHWTKTEIAEFGREVRPMAKRLGYTL